MSLRSIFLITLHQNPMAWNISVPMETLRWPSPPRPPSGGTGWWSGSLRQFTSLPVRLTSNIFPSTNKHVSWNSVPGPMMGFRWVDPACASLRFFTKLTRFIVNHSRHGDVQNGSTYLCVWRFFSGMFLFLLFSHAHAWLLASYFCVSTFENVF